jgi:formate dehydrogenase subunit delta
MSPEPPHAKSVDKLVYMANQIGKFFAGQGPEVAVPGTAEHIRKFWDPKMRAAILRYVAEDGDGLDPIPLQAIQSLQK